MKFSRLAVWLLITLAGYSSSLLANSATIQFIDQYGKPLTNLVVEVVYQSQSQKVDLKQLTVRSNERHIMDQVDKAFKPELLLIRQGDDVSFPNSDNIRHHVYSFSQVKPFELKLYSGRPTNPITFPQHGVVTLGCNIHDSMVGFIYVAKSSHAFLTGSDGKITVTRNEPIIALTTWHPQQQKTPELPLNMDISQLQGSGVVQYTIETILPPARDTFGAKFKDAQ